MGPFPVPGSASDLLTGERAPDVVNHGTSLLACPNCHRSLTALHVGDPPTCEIDQCETCGGVWFDHQEWEHLAALQQWTQVRLRMDATPTWGNWWFQLLSQLPVEFNIRPRRFPAVTALIVVLNVLAFLYQVSVPEEEWIGLAARADQIISGRNLWAFVTSMFLHGGWAHLIGNMYMLYILGDNVEDVLGRVPYLVFYLVCGIAATIAFVVLNPDSTVPLVGASGAIAGVMAAYFLLFRQSRLTIMLIFWQRKVPVWIWLGFWFLLNFYMSVVAFGESGESGGVAWVAHVAGFIAGLAIIWPQEKRLVQGHALLTVVRRMG